MSRGRTEDTDAAVEDLLSSTEALVEPMADLSAQMEQLSERMGDVADGMARFGASRDRSARTPGGHPRGARPSADD